MTWSEAQSAAKLTRGEAGRAVEDEVIVGGANRTEPFCKRKMQIGAFPHPLVGKVVGGEHGARRQQVDVRRTSCGG